MNIVKYNKPTKTCSLYDFFEHYSEINKLKVVVTKISLICGTINDNTITSAKEASNMVDLNALRFYLKNKPDLYRMFYKIQ